MQLRLQPLTHRDLQAQLRRTQQGPRQRQHDPTRPQLEKLPCSVVSAGDLDSPLLQDALADDCFPRSTDLERIFPSIDRSSRPLDVCGPKGFLSFDAVHHTIHRLFILAVCALHLYVAAKTNGKSAALATLSGSGISGPAQRRHRGNSQPAPSDPSRETELAHHPGAWIV